MQKISDVINFFYHIIIFDVLSEVLTGPVPAMCGLTQAFENVIANTIHTEIFICNKIVEVFQFFHMLARVLPGLLPVHDMLTVGC